MESTMAAAGVQQEHPIQLAELNENHIEHGVILEHHEALEVKPHTPHVVVQPSRKEPTGVRDYRMFLYVFGVYLVSVFFGVVGTCSERYHVLAAIGAVFWLASILYFLCDLSSCCWSRVEDPAMWKAYKAYTAATMLNLLLFSAEIIAVVLSELGVIGGMTDKLQTLRIIRIVEVLPVTLMGWTVRKRYLMVEKVRSEFHSPV